MKRLRVAYEPDLCIITRYPHTASRMPLALRHRRDPVPALTSLPQLTVRRVDRADVMSTLQERPQDIMQRRFSEGHRAYVAYVDDVPAAWGWVATQQADIGEVGRHFTIASGERYLWNFVTRVDYRGRGIYPRLLDAIVRAESKEAERFWIAYAPENHASGAGIQRAGFVTMAELSFDTEGRPALRELIPGGARAAARVFGIHEVSSTLTPCWRCVRAGRPPMSCEAQTCVCDYQQPKVECVA